VKTISFLDKLGIILISQEEFSVALYNANLMKHLHILVRLEDQMQLDLINEDVRLYLQELLLELLLHQIQNFKVSLHKLLTIQILLLL
jgi:hypothetical protein